MSNNGYKGQISQNEIIVEMYSRSLVRATGKPIKVMKNSICLYTNSCFGGPHQ